MTAVVQRVQRSGVSVEGKTVGKIGRGLNVLIGVRTGDTEAEADFLAHKISNLRIFEDRNGKMNLSLKDLLAKGEDASVLAISQFTLCGDCRKGMRPSFAEAMEPEGAIKLYKYFTDKIREEGIRVEEGIFGADMKVDILNDGPVTLIITKDHE